METKQKEEALKMLLNDPEKIKAARAVTEILNHANNLADKKMWKLLEIVNSKLIEDLKNECNVDSRVYNMNASRNNESAVAGCSFFIRNLNDAPSDYFELTAYIDYDFQFIMETDGNVPSKKQFHISYFETNRWSEDKSLDLFSDDELIQKNFYRNMKWLAALAKNYEESKIH
jgi:hypothetical protein